MENDWFSLKMGTMQVGWAKAGGGITQDSPRVVVSFIMKGVWSWRWLTGLLWLGDEEWTIVWIRRKRRALNQRNPRPGFKSQLWFACQVTLPQVPYLESRQDHPQVRVLLMSITLCFYGRKIIGTEEPLMKVKEKSEKAGLKLSIQKMKIWHPVPSLHGK